MKKETGIILLVVGLVIGFVAGLITSTAMRPSLEAQLQQEMRTRTTPPGPTGQSPDSYADTQKAEQQAAMKAKLEEQIKSMKIMLEREPENIQVFVGLGNAYFDIGQHYEAIDYYEKALKLDPNMPDVLVDLGIMLRRTDKIEKALETFDKALQVNPKHANAFLNKAVVLKYDLKDFKGSLENFENFVKYAPKSHPMMENAKSEIAYIKEELTHDHPPGEGH